MDVDNLNLPRAPQPIDNLEQMEVDEDLPLVEEDLRPNFEWPFEWVSNIKLYILPTSSVSIIFYKI